MVFQLADALDQATCRRLCGINDDFEGGEIVFEQHGRIIKPRTGLMVIFPSDRDHVHEVLPVVAGARYSVQTWFTRQSEEAMAKAWSHGLRIPQGTCKGARTRRRHE